MDKLDFLTVYFFTDSKKRLQIKIKNDEKVPKLFPQKFIDKVCEGTGQQVAKAFSELKHSNIKIEDLPEIILLSVILTNDDENTQFNVKEGDSAKLLLPETFMKNICEEIGRYFIYMFGQLKIKSEKKL